MALDAVPLYLGFPPCALCNKGLNSLLYNDFCQYSKVRFHLLVCPD